MRLISIALLTALAAPLPTFAAPSPEQIAAARLAYIEGDYRAALDTIRAAAEAGNAMALNILGAAYEDGKGVEQNAAKAIDLFEQAAKAGEVRARYNLGALFAFGSGTVAEDRARATREFRLAAAAGYAPAMTALGQLQERATPPDYGAATDWYEKAHDKGDVVATANLGHAYVKGQGRREDWTRARLLYTEAAARGYPRAFNDLGVMHEQGYGVHADAITAFSFFLRGVETGYAKAGINLAELIVKARFPFASKDMALGYCFWGLDGASALERAEFQADCSALEEIIQPDDTARARARGFADRLRR
ncbi:tetratricopeptide repeat protein [Planktotalea arctica]|uniref:tetratricopeptide repeat protein n=1 Tax=Planktotalea arctica TaxID=1481893 RepID=UPI001592E030|nr:tetratricopeptide repeat protein [Planktotalea arctica]